MLRRILVAVCALVACGVPEQAAGATFTNSTPIAIPDEGAATPYPSTIGVAGLQGNVSDVNATLAGLSHTCLGDLRFLLVGPGGQKTILLSTVGTYTGCNLEPDLVNGTITLDDEASATYPCNAQPSGTFKPTAEPSEGDACTGGEPFPPPAPPGPYPVALSALDGRSPNGTWSLFVLDQFIGDTGTLSSWSLEITAGACAAKAASIAGHVGTGGDDTITGTSGPDVLIGNAGNDTIRGLGGKDVICGGPGKDKIFGGAGKDLLRGEAGKDKLAGGKGKDNCIGGAKLDTAKGCEKEKSV